MSWRFIFAVLLICAGASVWGGLHLGEWLVAHGPVAKEVAQATPVEAVPVLDANGQPYTAQPPQPLVDGELAQPTKLAAVTWQIPEQSLNATMDNTVIAVATTPITMVEATQLADAAHPKLEGIADVGNLGLSTGQAAHAPLQPIEVPPSATQPAAPPRPVASRAWQAQLRHDLQVCSAQGFFDRPSCAWAARNKYCGPNNAWGEIRECPAKNF
jgi:hypothetical protein